MSDLSAMRELNFLGSKEEPPNWSEKFLARAKHSGIIDVLLGKKQIQRLQKGLRRRQKKEEES
jgi:hypothetical protein